MQCSRKIKVTDLNPHLICVLCGGYYVEATTIIECLHSFCKSCIVKYLETNKYCPICDVQVHKTRPLQNIRPDNTLQTIVYKLVPGLYQNEMRSRREFYSKHPEAKLQAATPEARGELTDQSHIFLPDEPFSLCLEYIGTSESQLGQGGTCGRRYLRCPAAVSVLHLHKLIRAKFGLAAGHIVDIFYKDEVLPENWTLMDVAYIYQWKRKGPIHLTYQILESRRKRVKLSHETCLVSVGKSSTSGVVNAACASNNLSAATSEDVGSLRKETAADVEWKEVQLQISENGVMSVTGVESNQLLAPSLQPVGGAPSANSSEGGGLINNADGGQSISNPAEDKVPAGNSPALTNSICSNNNSINTDNNYSNISHNNNNSINSVCHNNTELQVANRPMELGKLPTVNVKNETDILDTKKDITPVKDISDGGVVKRPDKAGGYKVGIDARANAIIKSKKDQLEDTVRNIAMKAEVNSAGGARHKVDTNKSKEELNKAGDRPLPNTRPLATAHKVYPGIKPAPNSVLKDDCTKVNNIKVEQGAPPIKMTPMEILNSLPQKKLQPNPGVRYKTLKAPTKPWNPSIPRAAILSMKHAQAMTNHNKDAPTTGADQNPPPAKQAKFFKVRNMPRFLGNPSSGVKPMYQVAPGTEPSNKDSQLSPHAHATTAQSSTILTSSATTLTVCSSLPSTCSSVSSSSSFTLVNTIPSSVSVTVTTTTTNNTTTAASTTNSTNLNSSISVTSHPIVAASTLSVTKSGKHCQNLTLMKIDPKTLSPIPVSAVPHMINNPPRNSSSPQPKKLPPPFTPGSPKHSNHYAANCRSAHSHPNPSSSGKTSLPVPRIPSPAHTGGLIPTNPFISTVPHTGHLLYNTFPNPFTPTDPSGNRLLPGPNTELIRAMSALCSSGSAFHPSLPPSISMLFNPHHAHHRVSQPDRTNFKGPFQDKQTPRSPPPAVQRIPPTNPSGKSTENSITATHQNPPNINCIQQSGTKVKKEKADSAVATSPKHYPVTSQSVKSSDIKTEQPDSPSITNVNTPTSQNQSTNVNDPKSKLPAESKCNSTESCQVATNKVVEPGVNTNGKCPVELKDVKEEKCEEVKDLKEKSLNEVEKGKDQVRTPSNNNCNGKSSTENKSANSSTPVVAS